MNYEWAEMYLDEAHTKGLVPVRCHCNVLAWAEDEEELRRIKNDTGSQLALMGCVPHYNTIDTPVRILLLLLSYLYYLLLLRLIYCYFDYT